MSVVNKMLKDLENREASGASSANYQPPAKKSSSALRIGLLVVVGALLIGVVYWWPNSTTNPTTTPAIAPINQMPASQDVTLVASSEPEPESVVNSTLPEPTADQASIESGSGGFHQAQGEMSAERQQSESESQTAVQPPADTAPAIQPGQNAALSTPPAAPAQPVIKPSAEDPEQTLKGQIRDAISRNDTPKAIQLLAKLIRLQPDNIAARKRLAALYFSAGRTTDAQQLLQKSVAEMPADSSLRLMYARLMVQQNETKLAYYTLQDINDYAQPSIELLGYRASLAQQLGLIDEALTDYAQLVVLDSQTAKWWLGQAVVADKKGDTRLAISSYREALSLNQLDTNIKQFINQRLNNLTGVSS